MTAMLKQLRSEWMRGRGRPVEKYCALVAMALAVMVPPLMILLGWRNPIMRNNALATIAFPNSVSAVRDGMRLFGPFLAASLGANIVGAEYQLNTWPWLLVRSTSRLRIIVVKTVTLAVRIVALAIAAVAAFVATAAIIRIVTGNGIATGSATIDALLIPFITVLGAMAFAAAVGIVVTVATRSVAFGTLTGAFTLPVLSAIRFKETAAWIPYIHLENVTARLLTGRPPVMLKTIYDFEMSGRASAGIVTLELLVVLAVAFLIFRRQEIVY
jgi:ABC-type transport system involved in multi-copper enzyme maturation permease subunit